MKSFILTLLLISSGCVQASATLSKICDSSTITFSPPTLTTELSEFPVKSLFTFPVGLSSDTLTTLNFVGGTLTNDIQDFSFVDEVNVCVEDPTNSNQSIIIADIQKPTTNTITFPGYNGNLVKYIDKQSNIIVDIKVLMNYPPLNSWNINADICASAGIDKTFNLLP